MIQLRVHQFGLTYEMALSPPVSTVIDAPGKLTSALVSQFDRFGLSLSDVTIEDGPVEDKGLSCEVEELDASIVLRADRFEVRFLSIEETGDEAAVETVRGIWEMLLTSSPDMIPKSHSVLFEIDCEAMGGSYREILENFCRTHQNLPEGTETAVVYYLPQDGSQGFLDSSLVLNRSAEVDGGVLLAATLVFDGKVFGPDRAIQAGRNRLKDLLSRLDVKLLRD